MVKVRLLTWLNDISFVARSARVSGVGKVKCEKCSGTGRINGETCKDCNGEGKREPTDKEIVEMIVLNDYSSALEHIVMSFEITELSKGNACEFLEHRIASHTGRSTRYHKEIGFGFVIPPKIRKIMEKYGIRDYTEIDKASGEDREVLKTFFDEMLKSREAYERLVEIIGKENARYVLPFATHTAYIWTINMRSLINFLGLRLCVRASPEMQEFARKVYKEVYKVFPEILEHVWCRGFNLGACPENEVRDSPQAKNCPFKNPNSNLFIPTKKQVFKGIGARFDFEEFKKLREKLLKEVENEKGEKI